MGEGLDGRSEEAREGQRERERGEVAAGLDGVDGLAGDAERVGQRALREALGGAAVADVVAHRCQVCLTAGAVSSVLYTDRRSEPRAGLIPRLSSTVGHAGPADERRRDRGPGAAGPPPRPAPTPPR